MTKLTNQQKADLALIEWKAAKTAYRLANSRQGAIHMKECYRLCDQIANG